MAQQQQETGRPITARDGQSGKEITFNWFGVDDPTEQEMAEIFGVALGAAAPQAAENKGFTMDRLGETLQNRGFVDKPALPERQPGQSVGEHLRSIPFDTLEARQRADVENSGRGMFEMTGVPSAARIGGRILDPAETVRQAQTDPGGLALEVGLDALEFIPGVGVFGPAIKRAYRGARIGRLADDVIKKGAKNVEPKLLGPAPDPVDISPQPFDEAGILGETGQLGPAGTTRAVDTPDPWNPGTPVQGSSPVNQAQTAATETANAARRLGGVDPGLERLKAQGAEAFPGAPAMELTPAQKTMNLKIRQQLGIVPSERARVRAEGIAPRDVLPPSNEGTMRTLQAESRQLVKDMGATKSTAKRAKISARLREISTELDRRRVMRNQPTNLEPLKGSLPGPVDIAKKVTVVGERLDNLTQENMDAIAEAYAHASRAVIDDTPAWVIRDPAYVAINAVDTGLGKLSSPEVMNVFDEVVDLWEAAQKGIGDLAGNQPSGQLGSDYVRQMYFAAWGKTTPPNTVSSLRALNEIISRAKSGALPGLNSASEIKKLRREFGKQVVDGPNMKNPAMLRDTPTIKSATGKVDPLEAALTPNVDQVTENGVRPWVGYIQSFDKAVPEIAALFRPILKAKDIAYKTISDSLKTVRKGVGLTGSKHDRQAFDLMGGKYGDMRTMSKPSQVTQKAWDFAQASGRVLDGLWLQLRGGMSEAEVEVFLKSIDGMGPVDRLAAMTEVGGGILPKLNYNQDYVTFLNDAFSGTMPPEVLRNVNREVAFNFMRPKSNLGGEMRSATMAMDVYVPAALHKIHLGKVIGKGTESDAFFKRLIEVRKDVLSRSEILRSNGDVLGARKLESQAARIEAKASMSADVIDSLTGGRNHMAVENWADNRFKSVASFLSDSAEAMAKHAGMNPEQARLMASKLLPTTAERAANIITSSFYKSVLGGNLTAGLNNLTQSINTAAETGLMRTVEAGFYTLGTGARKGALAEKILADMMDVKKMAAGSTELLEAKKVAKKMAKERVDLGNDMTTLFDRADGWLDDLLFEGKVGGKSVAPFVPLFGRVEAFNRGVAFHAGLSQAMEAKGIKSLRGLTATTDGQRVLQELVDEAQGVVNKTQFIYDKMSKPAGAVGGPVRQQLGVLTSFPIKQAEFLGGKAMRAVKGDMKEAKGLATYFILTGVLAAALDKADWHVNALDPMVSMEVGGVEIGVSGLESITSFGTRGAPVPAMVVGKAMMQALYGGVIGLGGDATTGDGVTQETIDSFTQLSDVMEMFVPGGVQAKRTLKSVADAQEGKRRQQGGYVPFVRDLVNREGAIIQDTDYVDEARRVMGIPSQEQEDERQVTRDIQGSVSNRRDRRARAQATLNDQIRSGASTEDKAASIKAIIDAGGSLEGVSRSRESSVRSQRDRVVGGLSEAEKFAIMRDHPELADALQFKPRQSTRRKRKKRNLSEFVIR